MAAPSNEILEKVFDESTDRIKVQVEGGVDLDVGDIAIGAVEIKDSTTDARAPVSATNGLAVDNKTLAPLASTSTKQDTEIASLASIDGKTRPTAAAATVISPTAASKAVTTSGTAVALVGSSTKAFSVLLIPKTSNTGAVYVGSSTVHKTTSPQITIPNGAPPVEIEAPVGYAIDLSQWFIDAAVNGEGVDFLYIS